MLWSVLSVDLPRTLQAFKAARVPCLSALVLMFVCAPSLWGSPRTSDLDSVMDSMSSVREVRGVAISPDGRHVAWLQQTQTAAGRAGSGTEIYVQDLGSSSAAPLRVTTGGENVQEEGLAWSADGRTLAFLSDRETPGQLQLYVTGVSKGPARRLTNLKGSLADPKWSPNGRVVAVLLTEGSTEAQGPTAPKMPRLGVAEEQIPEERIVTVDVDSGRLLKISPSDLYVYEYDWSPDGKSFAATAAHGEGDDNWYVAQLYTINAVSGAAHSIWKPPLQIAVPRWSPDGRNIAVIEGLMSDEGITGGDIFEIPASGGEARNLTPGMKASASWLTWQDGSRILCSESLEGQSALASLDVGTGGTSVLWQSEDSNTTGGFNGEISLAADHKTAALVLHSFQHPPEVWAGPIGAWKQITHLNTSVRPAWGRAENIRWENQGIPIQGWLLHPLHEDPARHYPILVAVHGGPSSMVRPRWPATLRAPYLYNVALLAHEGYFIFYPNPRGSLGQGEEIGRASCRDFGHGDLQDILAGVDQVVRSNPVDANRIAIAGWSYGGYMAMFAVTQTNRFRAAIAGAGIANWQSYYGENRIDQWLIPFFGASVYDDPAVYSRSSPIDFIKNVKTPTLILVGERDGECPEPQSLEFWHALKTLGVPTQLVVYPGEGHQIVREDHRRDVVKRTMTWLDQYLGSSGP